MRILILIATLALLGCEGTPTRPTLVDPDRTAVPRCEAEGTC